MATAAYDDARGAPRREIDVAPVDSGAFGRRLAYLMLALMVLQGALLYAFFALLDWLWSRATTFVPT